MSRVRLQAPAADGTILAEPHLDQVARLIAQNRALLDSWQYDFQGRSASRVRAMSRASVLAAARAYGHEDATALPATPPSHTPTTDSQAIDGADHPPLLVTGHQPELFHPGVWVKNFVSSQLARQCGGTALHIVVDNDTVKKTTVRLPTGTWADPSVVHVPFDRWRGEIPFEEYAIADASLFEGFGDRVTVAMESLGVRPLADKFWAKAVAASRQTNRLSECIARARRWQEAAWDCRNHELPVSRLCQTEGFLWFASHILAQLDRFSAAYNQALADYRQRNRVRSRNHPVPALATDGEWHEAPFWVWSDRSPRRRQLFARQQGRSTLLTDRDGWTVELPLGPDREACCAVEVLADLLKRGVKIRTRALTTTIFSRVCLGELFIHGLGGARYDEVTDAIIRRFFGLQPPPFLVLTGTLRLPFAPRPGTPQQLHDLQRLDRDLIYSPDRFIAPEQLRSGEDGALLQAKREMVTMAPSAPAQRRRRYEEIRRINAALAPYVAGARADAAKTIEDVRTDIAANAILLGRDWPFCAYPDEKLRDFFQLTCAMIRPNP
jgi:hypothetical protein